MVSSPVAMSYRTFDHTRHVHSFLVFENTSHTLLRERQPCADLRRLLSGVLAEPPSLIGYKPKQLAEFQDLAEHEDLLVQPLFFHRPNIASTYDSAENIVTPPPNSGTRKLDVQCILRSDEYRETCRVAFKPKLVESRNASRWRGFLLKTSTGFWDQRTFLQML